MTAKTMFTVLAAIATAACGPAFSDGNGSLQGKSSYTVRLEGYVPVICRVSVEGPAVSASMTEFCNNPGGYQVWIDHQAGLDGAAIQVDGQRIGLSPSGATLISASSTAAFRTRQIAVEGEQGQIAALSLRIVPL
jgi:hypothetical protein